MKEAAQKKTVLACDLGASSGRVLAIGYDGKSLSAHEVRRFRNVPVLVNGTLYWNILNLLTEIKTGIAESVTFGRAESVAIDTWGVDFGLIGADGQLLCGVVHYRDDRTSQYERLYDAVCREELYARTGIQEMPINTIYQLDYLNRDKREWLAMASDILPVPDLLNYFLTGNKQSEYTIASTSGLLDAKARNWDRELIGKIGLNADLFRNIVMPGTPCGGLSEEVRNAFGIPEMEVISVAAHDTASAVFAASAISFNAQKLPSSKDKGSSVFLSCGTWCLLGVETDDPCTTEKAMSYGFTNEGGVGGKILFMKNITGTWLVQECARRWRIRGKEYSYESLDELASAAQQFGSIIDVEDSSFVMPEDMPTAIGTHAAKHSACVPMAEGEMVRCIYEGLALMFRRTIDEMNDCIGNACDAIHIIGGGAKSALLCQIIADITRRQVVSGSSEATALGNAAMQLIALGEFANEDEAKYALAAGGEKVSYEPRASVSEANDYYAKYLEIIGRRN